MAVWLVIFIILLCFSVVILFGAPYLPTLGKQQQQALDMLGLKPGQSLLELGSGDGRMLLAAARRGIHATGYELNPILVVISYIVTWRYRKLITIKWGNIWQSVWPQTDGIYVFLLEKFMKKLDKNITQLYKGNNVKVVSYTFKIPDKTPAKIVDALYLYEYKGK